MTVIRCVNLAFQLSGDHKLVTDASLGADVLVLVECRDRDNQPIRIGQIFGRDWTVWQDTSDGARAGTAIAVRKGSGVRRRRTGGPSRLMRLSTASSEVQARYLRSVALVDADGPFTVAGAHLPLPAAGRQQSALRSLARWWRAPRRGRKVVMGDGNMHHTEVRTAIGAAHSGGAEVMYACWSRGWGRVSVQADNHPGSDHPILTANTNN